MKFPRTFFWAAAPLLLLVQLFQSTPSMPPIWDIHESIESMSNVLTLQETMQSLNIKKVTLQGIPKDILYFTDSNDLSLSDAANNNQLIQQVTAQTQTQDTFGFFCTIDPLDAERVNKMKDCLMQGAGGVKLYNGYSYAHVIPVDDPRLSELYQSLSDADGVLMLALNSGEYQGELENVLSLNPDLKVICPHYCLASQSLDRLTDLMNRFPNLYVDTSFGQASLAKTGFETISQNHDAFESFFTTFQDRILFGTDNVLTTYEDKDQVFLTDLYQNYIAILSEGTADYTGLNLPYPLLRKVLWQNAADLLQ